MFQVGARATAQVAGLGLTTLGSNSELGPNSEEKQCLRPVRCGHKYKEVKLTLASEGPGSKAVNCREPGP